MPKITNRRKGRHHFYNRVFLLNAIVFLIILVVFATVASRLSFQVELDRLQQKNRDALAAVCSYYDTKHDEYVNMVYPFYDDRANYLMLSDLLESTNTLAFEEDPYLKRDIADRMARLVARDEDVEAVFLYSNVSRRQFVYWKRFNTFEELLGQDVYSERLQKTVIGRVPFGVRTLNATTLSVKPKVYGIASSVGTLHTRTNSGKMVIAYNAELLHRVFQRYSGSIAGQCLILSDEGEVIFNSTGDYPVVKYPNMELTNANGTSRMVDGENAYILTLVNPARKYTGLMIVPVGSYAGKANATSNVIYASCAGFALLSALLYFLAGLRVSRRVTELETAMDKVGANNLQYRIHLKGREDEFEHIGQFFNRMCDDLQENIDRMYVYELKQKNAELGALQARINPHFLYNSLETIRARLFADGNEEASDMITQLASIFRSITKEKTVYSIRQEINFIRMYLNLFAFRHGGNLRTEIDADADIMECGIVKYLLQPVVENYFIHGYDQRRQDNCLTIRGGLDGGIVTMMVCDNGKGIEPGRLQEIQEMLMAPIDGTDGSYGLSNVNARIRLIFGPQYGLAVESKPGESTCIILRVRAMTCEALEEALAHPIHSERELEEQTGWKT